jgi:hypothetical protein
MPLRPAISNIISGSSEPSMWMCNSALGISRKKPFVTAGSSELTA